MADRTANMGQVPWLWHDNGDGTYSPTVSGGAGGSGDGAIQDGANSSIEATVFDRANANPLATQLVDSNGDPVSVGGGTQYTEDVAAPADPVGNAMELVRDDALSGQVTADGDWVAARGTDKGELYVKHVDAIPVTDNGGSLTVDGTVTATGPLTDAQLRATSVPVALAEPISVDDNGGSLTVDGPLTDAQLRAAAVPVSLSEPISVDDNGGSITVDGTFWQATQPVSGTVTANQGAAGTAWEVVGDVAADAAVAANPVGIGARASTAVPTAMSADGDSVHLWANRNGVQVVTAIPGAGLNADPYTLLSESAQYTTTQTSTVLVAGGASERIIVTSIQIQCGGTTAGTLQVYFGTGAYARGTDEAIFDGEFAPSATLKPGVVMQGPFRAGALGDDILVTTSAAINPLTITVWYYVLGV